jgi:hypothetical protein
MKEDKLDVEKTIMISTLISITTLATIHRMILQSMFQFVSTNVTENHLSQTGNWEIDLIVQRMSVYDLNHIFEVNIGARPHENMDMSADMKYVLRYY